MLNIISVSCLLKSIFFVSLIDFELSSSIMAYGCTSAYYGVGKKLRTNSWRGVEEHIERRLASGDLSSDLHFLSFANRPISTDGWPVITRVMSRLDSCLTLDLQNCGIKPAMLISLLPDIIHKTKNFNHSPD